MSTLTTRPQMRGVSWMTTTLAMAGLLAMSATAAPNHAAKNVAGGGLLTVYSTLQDFQTATADYPTLSFENFDGGPAQANDVRPCDEPLNSLLGQPGTSFINPCFAPGNVIDGFSIRSSSGSGGGYGLYVVGPGIFGGTSVIVGAMAGANTAMVSFANAPTAVAFDAYDWQAGAGLTVSVYGDGNELIDSFDVQPSAPNSPAFAGFTSQVPIARVDIRTSANTAAFLDNLRFGGGPGRLVIDTDAIDFGAVEVSDTASHTVTLHNAGQLSVDVNQIATSTASFVIAGGNCASTTLAPNASCSFDVNFSPDLEQGFADVAFVHSGDLASPVQEIALSGHGVVPALAMSTDTLNFGAVAVGGNASASVVLANPTAVAIHVASIAAASAPFSAGGDCGAPPFDLAPGASCTLTYTFSPTAGGAFDAYLAIGSNDPTSPAALALHGFGGGDLIFANGFEAVP